MPEFKLEDKRAQKFFSKQHMSKEGPIIIIEDDPDDQEMMKEVLYEIGVTNKVIFFTNAVTAFDYLKLSEEQQFLIISDVNLPKQTGIEFKRRIDADPELRRKSIPFIFLSTTADKTAVNKAFTEMTVQGFFLKCNSFEQSKEQMKTVIDYWKLCKHPNTG